jgi:hypothetical protein
MGLQCGGWAGGPAQHHHPAPRAATARAVLQDHCTAPPLQGRPADLLTIAEQALSCCNDCQQPGLKTIATLRHATSIRHLYGRLWVHTINWREISPRNSNMSGAQAWCRRCIKQRRALSPPFPLFSAEAEAAASLPRASRFTAASQASPSDNPPVPLPTKLTAH